MKHIFLNLKRFDIPTPLGGVNSIAPIEHWAEHIVSHVQQELLNYAIKANFTIFFPEAHLLQAKNVKQNDVNLRLGCQGVYPNDVAQGGNFGAFTTFKTASVMKALDAQSALIGHCEERNDLFNLLNSAGVEKEKATTTIHARLNAEIKMAQKQGMDVLYCIGEKAEEQEKWEDVLYAQLTQGLDGVDLTKVIIAYEPIWSIGPGKTPADAPYIEKIVRFIKNRIQDIPVVYGGGLKKENAQSLANIDCLDGGLIALTQFTGNIGFYPEGFLDIIKTYMENIKS